MELAILDNKIPVKAIPEEKLNEIILTVFIDWLSGLLSLTGETSSSRLEVALPAIKKHCWSMGFDEIKEMFELYADNKLDIEPKPNYFDRILFGKIVTAYQNFKKVKPPKESPEVKEKRLKDEQDIIWTILEFDAFIQNRKIPEECVWLYDFLELKGLINYSEKEKKAKYKVSLEKENGDNERAILVSKIALIEDYFKRLEAKEQHVKDFLYKTR